MGSVLVLPLFFPVHNTCVCLHWWSPLKSPALPEGLSWTREIGVRWPLTCWQLSLRISSLGNSAPWKGWPATVLFSPAPPHVTRTGQNCYLNAPLKHPGLAVGYLCHLRPAETKYFPAPSGLFERCWLPFFS